MNLQRGDVLRRMDKFDCVVVDGPDEDGDYIAVGIGVGSDPCFWIGDSAGATYPFSSFRRSQRKATMLGSIGSGHEPLILDGRLCVGCQQLTKRETLALFRRFGEALGYEVD